MFWLYTPYMLLTQRLLNQFREEHYIKLWARLKKIWANHKTNMSNKKYCRAKANNRIFWLCSVKVQLLLHLWRHSYFFRVFAYQDKVGFAGCLLGSSHCICVIERETWRICSKWSGFNVHVTKTLGKSRHTSTANFTDLLNN